jgi:hypothetical protein
MRATTGLRSSRRSSPPSAHEVIAREIDVKDVGTVTARERPDVALVDSEKAHNTRST